MNQTVAQGHGRAARATAIRGAPEGTVAQRNIDRLVHEDVVRPGAVFKRGAIHKRLES